MVNDEKLKKIQRSKEKWEKETVSKSFEKLPERGEFATSSEIPINRTYTPTDLQDSDYLRDVGFPGE